MLAQGQRRLKALKILSLQGSRIMSRVLQILAKLTLDNAEIHDNAIFKLQVRNTGGQVHKGIFFTTIKCI